MLASAPAYPALVAGLVAAAVVHAVVDFRLAMSHPFLGRFARLAELGLAPRDVGLAVAAALVAACVGLAYLIVGHGQVIVAVILGPLVVIIADWVLSLVIRRRERRLRNQLADLSQQMAGALRANLVPAEALESAITATPKPLGALLERAYTDYENGKPLLESIEAVAARLKLDALSLFSTAVGVSMKHGTDLGEALGRIATSIRMQQALEDKLQALTASGRSSLVVLAIFPFGFAAFFYQLDPTGYDKALESMYGQLAAGGAVAITFFGVWWGNQILARVGR